MALLIYRSISASTSDGSKMKPASKMSSIISGAIANAV